MANSDCPKDNSSSNGPDHQNEEITRRDLLAATAKSVVGLTMAPLSYVQAGNLEGDSAKIKVITSELLASTQPTGLNLTSSATSAIPTLRGDINNDGKVDEKDLRIMVSEWLTNDASARSNLDDSYTYFPGSAASEVYVDLKDFSILANDWRMSRSACSALRSLSFNRSTRRRFDSPIRRRFIELMWRQIESA